MTGSEVGMQAVSVAFFACMTFFYTYKKHMCLMTISKKIFSSRVYLIPLVCAREKSSKSISDVTYLPATGPALDVSRRGSPARDGDLLAVSSSGAVAVDRVVRGVWACIEAQSMVQRGHVG